MGSRALLAKLLVLSLEPCSSRGAIIFTVFAVSHCPRKFNRWIIHIHVLVLMLFVWVQDSTCCQFLPWDMALLQSVPREQLPNPEGSLSVVVPPAAIRAAIDCVRQTDEGAKKKRGSPVHQTIERETSRDWLANMHLTTALLPRQGTICCCRGKVSLSLVPGSVFSFAKG